MKKLLRYFLIILLLLIVAVVGAVLYLSNALPNIEAQELVIEPTAERLERGEYLVQDVMMCLDCHAQRDWDYYSAPVKEGTRGAGGEAWTREMGLPGNIYSKNISPAALGDWTDGELYRAITSGVSKDGHALFSVMPYPNYARLEKEDIYSIIAFLRTLEPVESEIPERELDFPVSMFVNLGPKEASHDLKADKSDPVKYGEYMITAAACYDCHTPFKEGKYYEDSAYAGGFGFHLPTGGTVYAANITPDLETGIGKWSEEQFLDRFRTYRDSVFTPKKVSAGEMNTVMPWREYSRMQESDLKAIYAYLMSLEPIKKKVSKFVSE